MSNLFDSLVCAMCRFILLVCALLAPYTANAADTVMAGTVFKLQGNALANRSGSSDDLHEGSPVWVGDHVVTGDHSRLLLKMPDGTMLTLGADTDFVIIDYRYSKKAQQGSASLELIKGVFRAVTGAIGKFKERDFRVKTPVATIGIRGTDFWGGFYFSQALDVALLDGKGIYVENAAGRVEVTAIGDGTTINSANESPTPPKHWSAKKLNAAKQSVALDTQP